MSGTLAKRGRRGIVLVTVVIAIAVLSTVVVDFIYSARVDYEISASRSRDVQARHVARSGIAILTDVMDRVALEDIRGDRGSGPSRVSVENSEDGWKLVLPPVEVGEGSISVSVRDERSKVNLNALVDQKSNRVDFQVRTQLGELFRFLGVEREKSELFISSLVNWLDREVENGENDQDPDGAGGAYYSALENPYRVKDGLLDSVGEIRMIHGMDEDFFFKVRDHVTVYPGDKRVNLSTASKRVIMATLKAARVSVRERRNGPGELRDEVVERMADAVIERRAKKMTVTVKEANKILRDADSGSNMASGLPGVVVENGRSDVFSARSTGVVDAAPPVTRFVEAVVSKDEGSSASVVSWRER